MALKGLDPKAIDGTIIASVVPDVLYPLASLSSHFFGVEEKNGEPAAAGSPVCACIFRATIYS